MNASSPHGDKFRRYRARKKASGLREIRMWVPDVKTAAFKEALARQIAAIKASTAEAEIMRGMDTLIGEVWNQEP